MSPEIAAEVENTPQPFVEGNQVDTAPQLSVAETEKGGAVGPGQEHLVEELEREQKEFQEQEQILGKFKTTEELAKAYAELQRKMGEQGSQSEDQADAEAEPEAAGDVEAYTPAEAAQVYGKELVQACAEKGLDLGQIMTAADSGQDISEHYDALAEAAGVPRNVIENYVDTNRPSEYSAGGEISEEQADLIRSEVGGPQGFEELTGWAKQTLPKAETDAYNAAVEAGNVDAIRWALKSFQAQRNLVNSDQEPVLYGGGAPAETVVKFESTQQMLDAMHKKNRGYCENMLIMVICHNGV